VWTTALNFEQGSNEDIYGDDDDKDKGDLVYQTMIHLFKTVLEEYVLCGIRWAQLLKN
jgi:hypothetical protein